MKSTSVSQMNRKLHLAASFGSILFLSCCALSTEVHAQTLTTLHSFSGTDGAFPDTQIVKARHRVVQHTNGNYYGVTPYGGANDDGVVYEVNSSGAEITLYNFCSIGGCADGEIPDGALALGNDGNLYGTTYQGGANNAGTVFKITTSGALTTLYSFKGTTDGANPLGALVQGSDGNFYGTTYAGGNSANSGTVFKITPGGSLTTIYSFSGPDGANPQGDLVQSPWNHNFYGLTLAGGNSTGSGTAFQISSSGSLSTIYDFCSKTNCNDGSYPQAPLTADAFGSFYGTTELSGANASGTLFVISPIFGLHTLYHFCSKTATLDGTTICTDGSEPSGGPLVGIDGNIYGTTALGGTINAGTVYEFAASGGVLNTLYNFCSLANCADGAYPESQLVQGTDQNFYGTTIFGGAYGYGTDFNLATVPNSGGSCNGVYSGIYWGNITVSQGQSCEWTDGGQVFGNIYVKGGNLILTNASVFGNVQIQGGSTYTLGPSLSIWSTLSVQNIPSGSAQNTVCGVNVNGSLYFDGNGTAAQIGSSAGSCPGNQIGGDLEVNGNTAPVQVFDNTVRDNLTCSGNSSVTGAGNTARQKLGQCSSF